MFKLTKTILTKTIWLGRGMATVMGLAMLLALTVGLASTALAGTGIGARFDLGETNFVNATSRLVGNVNGPVLTVKNTNGTSSDNVPLSLETTDIGFIPPPPMKVNSTGKVSNLNVDLLDGRDSTAFVPTKTYQVTEQRTGAGGGSLEQRSPKCDQGDVILNGGFSTVAFQPDSGVVVVENIPSFGNTWLVRVVDVGNPSFIAGIVTCGDLPPLRQ